MARRGRQRKRRSNAGKVSVDSFADLAFLLIIFFLVAATLIKTRGFMAELPSGDPAEDDPGERQPTIALMEEGLQWNGTETDLVEIRGRLAEMDLPNQVEARRVIILESVPSVEYERYFQVWSAIAVAGGIVALKDDD